MVAPENLRPGNRFYDENARVLTVLRRPRTLALSEREKHLRLKPLVEIYCADEEGNGVLYTARQGRRLKPVK